MAGSDRGGAHPRLPALPEPVAGQPPGGGLSSCLYSRASPSRKRPPLISPWARKLAEGGVRETVLFGSDVIVTRPRLRVHRKIGGYMDGEEENLASRNRDWKPWIIGVAASVIATILFEAVLKPGYAWISTTVISQSRYFTNSLVDRAAVIAASGPDLIFDQMVSMVFTAIVIYASMKTIIRIFHPPVRSILGSLVTTNTTLFPKPVYRVISFTFILIFATTVIINGFLFEAACDGLRNYREVSAILAAHLPDKQIKDLDAEWVSIRSAKDYDALADRMNNLAKENHITLPKFSSFPF
jgi:hypothetical protein